MHSSVPFTCLSRNLPVEITQQTLPHLVQPEVSYFFTFRLADSVPKTLLEEWVRQRNAWLAHHPLPLTQTDTLEYAERFTKRMDACLDAGHGTCALRDPNVRKLVEEAITKFDGVRLDLDAVVIMPNHVHLLLKPRADENVFKLIGGMKGYSARVCNKLLGLTKQAFWMEDSYNRIVRDHDELRAFRDYIRRNPVEAKLRDGEFTLIEKHVLK
jgi:putative transposase